MLADLWCPCLSSQPVGILYISPQHLYSLKWKLKCGGRQKRRANRFDRKQVQLPQEDYYWYFDKYIGEHLAARINVTPSVSVGTLTVQLETPSGLLVLWQHIWRHLATTVDVTLKYIKEGTLTVQWKSRQARINVTPSEINCWCFDSIFGDTWQQRLM